jgi:hypothetical protein
MGLSFVILRMLPPIVPGRGVVGHCEHNHSVLRACVKLSTIVQTQTKC